MPRLRTAFLIAALLLAATAPAAGARGWLPRTILSQDDAYEGAGDAAADGTVAAAWSERGFLRATVRPGLPPTTLDPQGRGAAVAIAGTGEVLLAWEHSTNIDWPSAVRAAIWSPTTGMGPTVELGTGVNAFGAGPAVAAAPDGEMAVAFDGGGSLLIAHRPAGGTLGAPEAAGTGWASVTRVGVGAGRVTAVVGGKDGTVRGVTGAPGAWTEATLATGAEPKDVAAGLTVDAQGRAAAVWGGPRLPFGGARTTGGAWTPIGGLPAETVASVALGGNRRGDAVAAWSAGDPGLRVGTFSVAAGDASVTNAGTGGGLWPGSVLVGADGTAVVAHRAAPWYDLSTVRREGLGAFGPTQAVACPGDNEYPVGGGVDDRGTAHLVVQHYDKFPIQSTSVYDDAAGRPDGPADCRSTQGTPSAGNGGLPTGGGHVPTPLPPKAPAATVRAAGGQRVAAVLRKGVRFSVASPVAVTMRARLWAAAGEAKLLKLGRRATVVGARAVKLKAGTTSFRVGLSKAAKRRLRKARRTVTLQLRLTRSGAPSLATTVRLKR